MAYNLCQIITCLGVLVMVGLVIWVLVKQHKCCKGGVDVKDYPPYACASNKQGPYWNNVSPEVCAAECNADPSNSCCGVVCSKNKSGQYVNCDPPTGLHCSTPLTASMAGDVPPPAGHCTAQCYNDCMKTCKGPACPLKCNAYCCTA